MNLSELGADTTECHIGTLVVSGRGIPSVSACWNNPIGKSSVAFALPLTDNVEEWVLNVQHNNEDGYTEPFKIVYEDLERTGQLVFSGEGAVYPHIFGRNEIAVILVVDIKDLKREVIEL